MVKNQKRIEQIAGIALTSAIVVGCGFVLRLFTLAAVGAAYLFVWLIWSSAAMK